MVVLLVLAFAGGGGTGSVRTPPASGGRDPDGGAVTTTVPQPTVTSVDHHGSGGSAADDTVPTPTADTGAATPGAGAGPVPETVPTSAPTPTTRSYSSAGGSIAANFDGSTVSLASSTPAGGFTAEVHDNGPSRVEVRFANGETEWRIRVDVDNGALVPEISQH